MKNKFNIEIIEAYKKINEDINAAPTTTSTTTLKDIKIPTKYEKSEKEWQNDLKLHWEYCKIGIPKNNRDDIKKYKHSLIQYIDEKILKIAAIITPFNSND